MYPPAYSDKKISKVGTPNAQHAYAIWIHRFKILFYLLFITAGYFRNILLVLLLIGSLQACVTLITF